jgi:hypothetical protein
MNKAVLSAHMLAFDSLAARLSATGGPDPACMPTCLHVFALATWPALLLLLVVCWFVSLVDVCACAEQGHAAHRGAQQ